ncbi:MAG: hypothetical protein QGH34_00690 [Candidatus Woesearchaeota archaeon]|jgi:uncharacterized protein with PQ loop repeat|nr:hypothetical protein [Candidatus Woesearchaeota archaeon]|tara:strand:- start:10955 stop:11299 length:345 start_codon:yes stop_codon:yes gene_type:complete
MPHSSLGLHHFHRRKRIHLKHEPYPHPNKWINFMDKAVYVVGAIGPLMTLPQISKIWFEKNASGVSILSWSAFLFYAIFWLIYGIIHKEKPIIFAYILWVTLQSLVVIGIIIYG